MRLAVTLPEIESGTARLHCNKSRLLDIDILSRNREPIAISPIRNHDNKIIAAIIPNGDDALARELKFRPVWCKLFTACSMRKNNVTRYFCEFDFGKYMIDTEGPHKADVTTGGNGTDPDDIRGSEILLGVLLDNSDRPPLVRSLIQFIQRSF